MVKIKVGYVDFWKGFDPCNNCLTDMLFQILGKEKIEINNKKPDYLFFSCFGYRHLKYDCIKIFFTGENIVPDFNICDYAIGVHKINFDDRYLRLPFYYWYEGAYNKALQKTKFADDYYLKRKFCCFVISNSLADPKREEMISLLNKYKAVDSGGRYLNNMGGAVKDKRKFTSNYKFSLCFENSMAKGYTTEKIIEGFAGNGIPIYWGNPDIVEEFNDKSFINCNSYENLADAVEYIKKVDQDEKLYLSYVKEPVFKEDSTGRREIIEKNLEFFLSNIFSQKLSNAKRINQVGIGSRYLWQMRFFKCGFSLYTKFHRIKAYFRNRGYFKMKKIIK